MFAVVPAAYGLGRGHGHHAALLGAIVKGFKERHAKDDRQARCERLLPLLQVQRHLRHLLHAQLGGLLIGFAVWPLR